MSAKITGTLKSKTAAIAILVAGLLAGVVFTWPMVRQFTTSIPYTLRPIPGFEQVPLMPGDHLSAYYWFWLFSDNLLGGSKLFTNPYEFNSSTGLQSAVYANFPLSLLYVLLLPLGRIAAYNALILISFCWSALAAYLLARQWTRDRWAALLAGLVFAVVPYRVSHVAGGQMFGYAAFLLPLCLYYVERLLASGKWRHGWAAGLCLLVLSVQEHHAAYLTVMTLGIYLPSRLLLFRTRPLPEPGPGPTLGPGLGGALAGGLGFALFLWTTLGRRAGLQFWHPSLLQPLLLGTLSVFLGWLFLSVLLSRCTILPFPDARDRVGKLCLAFAPLLLTTIQYRFPIPRLGLALGAACGLAFTAQLVALFIRKRDPLPDWNRRVLLGAAVTLGSCLIVATIFLMHMRSTVLLPSVAGTGRTLNEVRIFSPTPANLLFRVDINQERFVFLGWGLLIMAVLGLVPLLRRRPQNPGYPALAGVVSFLSVVLTLGPTLAFFPLYRFLYDYIPFFNYPRVPGRFVMVGLVFLSLLAALALASFREWLAGMGFLRLRRLLPLALLPTLLAEYHTWSPLGLCALPADNRVFDEIRRALPAGRMVLELPIWPGSSHQSSTFEYTVTRTGKPMINGYAPVHFRGYVDQVFWPLYPLDHGELTPAVAAELERNNVGLVTFHDDALVYTGKVSPFPPRLALKRLAGSPALELLSRDGDLSLFRFRGSQFAGAPPASIDSPVQAIFQTAELPAQASGRHRIDPDASGYYLLLDERSLQAGKKMLRPGARGNVVQAEPGRDQAGYMLVTAGRFLPSGKYRANFRLRAGGGSSEQEVARLEIAADRDRLLAQRLVRGADLAPAGTWVDLPCDFEIAAAREIAFKVRFSGNAPVGVNLVTVGFADQGTGPLSVEAEDLLRQTGTVVGDPLASGREAVLGRAGHHATVYLAHGPYRTLESGAYRAAFFLRRPGTATTAPASGLALLEVATDLGRRVFASRVVPVGEIDADAYRPLAVDFQIPFRCEVDLRIKYMGGADLLADRIDVASSGTEEKR